MSPSCVHVRLTEVVFASFAAFTMALIAALLAAALVIFLMVTPPWVIVLWNNMSL